MAFFEWFRTLSAARTRTDATRKCVNDDFTNAPERLKAALAAKAENIAASSRPEPPAIFQPVVQEIA